MERALSTSAPSQDQWEYDRQQNIIDTIDQASKAGAYSDDETAERTAAMRRAEALSIQQYLVTKNLENEAINEAISRVDQDWVAKNPPPPPVETPDPKDGDDIGIDPQ